MRILLISPHEYHGFVKIDPEEIAPIRGEPWRESIRKASAAFARAQQRQTSKA